MDFIPSTPCHGSFLPARDSSTRALNPLTSTTSDSRRSIHGSRDFESRSLFRFVIKILPGIGSFGRAYDSSASIEYGGIHAECRVLAEWCADYNCRRLDDDRRRPRTSTIQPAASGGLTFTGGTCVSWDPEGGPYLSDCVDGGPTETRHP